MEGQQDPSQFMLLLSHLPRVHAPARLLFFNLPPRLCSAAPETLLLISSQARPPGSFLQVMLSPAPFCSPPHTGPHGHMSSIRGPGRGLEDTAVPGRCRLWEARPEGRGTSALLPGASVTHRPPRRCALSSLWAARIWRPPPSVRATAVPGSSVPAPESDLYL
ncbi:hypothetical protein SKAU_G00375210 [Synaphobranchus kaupii]|uniref:Uncharacterized protein n=1 Tax=Synaphobranchus kaupii TaxID=118154 RepID=A0A9Q1EGX0_SYNKA|nr:hypothetical protein SKAU_G00375210 [Synaphobranchus kaupii]